MPFGLVQGASRKIFGLDGNEDPNYSFSGHISFALSPTYIHSWALNRIIEPEISVNLHAKKLAELVANTITPHNPYSKAL